MGTEDGWLNVSEACCCYRWLQGMSEKGKGMQELCGKRLLFTLMMCNTCFRKTAVFSSEHRSLFQL